MKAQNLLAAFLLFLIITGCSKLGSVHPTNLSNHTTVNANENDSVTLAGKWQLVQDSTANSMVRTSALVTNYMGSAGDYFDFRNDGYCYTKEGGTYDTLAYQEISPESITMQKFGLIINGVIETSDLTLTANTAVIKTRNMLTPGGTLIRKVYLKR